MSDHLAEKLEKAVPGAVVEERHGSAPTERFVVVGKNPRAPRRGLKELSHGATRSEAVDRAVWLFGRPR